MGDSAAAATYTKMAQTINSTLYSSHFNGGFVQECNSRTRDSAVIVGFNDGFDESDRMFAPTSYEAAITVSSYNTMFCNEYAINTADTAAGLPGVLYGRYQGDSYAGGNPWVLSTAALASLFYRGALDILTHGVPASSVLDIWQKAFNSASALPTDKASLAKYFAAQGDGVLIRLRSHVVARGFHLDEQIDRNTGAQVSAKDLTWSVSPNPEQHTVLAADYVVPQTFFLFLSFFFFFFSFSMPRFSTLCTTARLMWPRLNLVAIFFSRLYFHLTLLCRMCVAFVYGCIFYFSKSFIIQVGITQLNRLKHCKRIKLTIFDFYTYQQLRTKIGKINTHAHHTSYLFPFECLQLLLRRPPFRHLRYEDRPKLDVLVEIKASCIHIPAVIVLCIHISSYLHRQNSSKVETA